jgi:hypothetical protein
MATDHQGLHTAGRHRLGRPYLKVNPTRWNPAERAAAANLNLTEPGWLVAYSLGRRLFYAIARWARHESVMVEAASIEQLHERMREAELAAVIAGARTAG